MNKKYKQKKQKKIRKFNKKQNSLGDLLDDGNRDQFPQFGKAPENLSGFMF